MILSKFAAMAAEPHFISAIETLPQPDAAAEVANAQTRAANNSIFPAVFICTSLFPLRIFNFANASAEKVAVNFPQLNFFGLKH